MSKAKRAIFRIRSYILNNFQVSACVENESKEGTLVPYDWNSRDAECRLFISEQMLQRRKRKDFIHCIVTGEKIDSLKQSKENRILGSARAWFFVAGSAKYPRCEGLPAYLVVPGRFCSLWVVETQRKHNLRRISNQLMWLSRSLHEMWPQYEQGYDKVILQHFNVLPHIVNPVEK